jgi:hypothetical protein
MEKHRFCSAFGDHALIIATSDRALSQPPGEPDSCFTANFASSIFNWLINSIQERLAGISAF